MSWAPEVIADETAKGDSPEHPGKWLPNRLRFATREEAERYLGDLMLRWTAVRDVRAVESTDPVNCRIVNGKLEHL